MKLTLEATNICPLPCHDNSKNMLSREKGVMDLTIFNKILEKSRDLEIDEIEISGVGEALLNPNIKDFIKLIKLFNPNIRIVLVTNGVLLTTELGEELSRLGLTSLIIILSPSHIPISLPQMGSKKGKIFENITLIGKYFQDIKIVHVLPQWSAEQRQIISHFWVLRGVKKVFFSSRLACGITLGDHTKLIGRKPPACALFRGEHYITWDGHLISCCHDNSGETAIGEINLDSIHTLIEKKKRIADRQFFYPICYECHDERRFSLKGIIGRTVRQLINSITS